MKNNIDALNRATTIINKGKTGIIVLPPNPSIDAIASATSLYLGLAKLGKTVKIACESNIESDLFAADKIQKDLTADGDNLVISFPYTEGSIDKVDYNIKGNSFNLIITPRPGYPKLDPSQVKYSYTGGIIDFFVTIDAVNLNSLGNIYSENQSQFNGRDIINIDRHLTNSFFGTVNFVNRTASSLSELILVLLQALNTEIDKNIATNLYAGLIAATNNFNSYSVNATTFESAAQLLKAGAIKKILKKPEIKFSPTQNNKETQTIKPVETVEKETQNERSTPQDWLRPKIFRGGNLI